jgi:cysteinyl-tRNA synthetase
MAKAKKKVEEKTEDLVKAIPTRVELVQAKISFKAEGNNIYFSVKELKKEYPFLTNHNHDEKKFDDDFVGIMISDLQIEK